MNNDIRALRIAALVFSSVVVAHEEPLRYSKRGTGWINPKDCARRRVQTAREGCRRRRPTAFG